MPKFILMVDNSSTVTPDRYMFLPEPGIVSSGPDQWSATYVKAIEHGWRPYKGHRINVPSDIIEIMDIMHEEMDFKFPVYQERMLME